MSAERGILYGGRVVASTEWVLREDGAWWTPGERGTRKRTGPADLLVGHWTAGAPHEGPRTAAKVVRNMKARKRADGSPMDVGIGFVIGWDGAVYQTADLDTATVHVSRGWNPRSIGVECCWPGTMQQAARLGVQPIARPQRVEVAGSIVLTMRPSPELLASWVRLAETLAAILPIPPRVPLDASGALLLDRMAPKRARSWTGAVEHLHSSSSKKIDAAGFLVGALRDAGWRGVST